MSPTSALVPAFPGRTISVGSTDSASVRAIQVRLNRLGCGPVAEDGVFGAETLEAIELFQARSVDSRGLPLTIDGRVGPMTWAALFGNQTVAPIVEARSALLKEALRVAAAELGVMEDPLGSNSGPRINQYLASVGLNAADGSFPWCAAFIFWCFREASASLNVQNPAVRTAGALDTWNQAGIRGIRRIATAEASETPAVVQPGVVFVISTGGGNGHVGLVERVDGVVLTTIEGNTNEGGSREGIGVFRRSGRRLAQINRGFVDYSEA
jgi:peptidoglycan hydrolase-like protein with peptidoglycan-binding domain